MRTLAEQLGVTKTTISLALRGHTSISKATRDRVTKLAQELNYRPDPAIAAIAAQRWSCGSQERHRVVAFLCHRSPDLKRNQVEYYPGVKERAEELGYKIEVFFIDDYPTAEALTRVLYTRGIRGIIVSPIQNPESKRAMNLEWDKFTAVCCGIGRIRPHLHTVSSDTFETTRRVWELIAKAGHRRIGAALHCHNPVADDDWQRIGASNAAIRFLNLSESAGIPIHTEDIYDDALLMKWYEQHKPEVVIGFNHSIGEHLERNGVRIPEDVEFISLVTPPGTKWSGIMHHNDQIARASMDILNNEIRDNRWGLPAVPNITHVQPEWNRGTSFRSMPEWKTSEASVEKTRELTAVAS